MVRWTPKSEEDLDLIREHIASNFNVGLALKITNELIDYAEDVLSKNPLAGILFEPNPIFSKLTYEGNSIFYCENPKDRMIYIVYVQPRGTLFQDKRLVQQEIA